MGQERLPTIVQGGMGVGVSGWRLARAVSQAGQLGVVSGVALDGVVPRRLQLGDPGGHVRRALSHFPVPEISQHVLDRYFIPGGKRPDQPFRPRPMLSERPSHHLLEVIVTANFVEVFLAKEGHDGLVGINFLEKVQLPTLASLYGAMLAKVDWVLMGAGIPRTIPGILDSLAEGKPVQLKLDVAGAGRGEEYFTRLDPPAFLGQSAPALPRPNFAAIIASATLATMLLKRATGQINGFVIEGPTAGGHNAPPRGRVQLTDGGEPIYGERDVPDLEAIRAFNLPFWLAGSYGKAECVVEALSQGATGVQVGTVFAYCNESDLAPSLKRAVLAASRAGRVGTFTDPLASPTGFPFKVVCMPETLWNDGLYHERKRVCDLAYLRHAYKNEDGLIGWRCPAEDVEDYVRKGGAEEDTYGRKCICNALFANIGLGQVRHDGEHELPLITSGDDVVDVARLLKGQTLSYGACDVIDYLLSQVDAPVCVSNDAANR